ncbi:MAG: methyltransferase domain-containing protein [Arenibacterium sp.]
MDDTVSSDALEAGRGYEALFVPALFGVWTKHLIKTAKIEAGQTVLDVACGTGVLARDVLAALGERSHVTGVDPTPGMLAVAKEIEPNINWVSGTAEEIPLADQSFDTVLSQFGMMFFQDKTQACREMYRVLKPGGILVLAVWNSTTENRAYQDMIALMSAEVGDAAANAVRLPFSLGDASGVIDALSASGFADITAATLAETARFPSTRTMVEAELRGWLPLFDIYLSEPEIARVLAASDTALAAHATPTGEAVFTTSAHIISARRP